jgi:hypothetical protein
MSVYEHFFIKPVKEDLLYTGAKGLVKMTEKKQMEKTQARFSLLKKITDMFNGKIIISLLTVLVFYIAELKHS